MALLIALGGALLIGFNVLRVLYGVIAPPLPPLPPDMSEISHESDAYGADVWRYTAASDPCAAAVYFESQGGTCDYSPMQCAVQDTAPADGLPETVVARCHGAVAFSIFHMQWWALVTRDNANGGTRLALEREVFWIGTGPREATLTP